MAPHLEQSLGSKEFRVLSYCGDLIPNRSVFWTIKDRGLSNDTVDEFASELRRFGQEIAADPEKAASLLSAGGDEAERRAWTRVVTERNWQINPADISLLREQQAESDTLFNHGDISKKLEIDTATSKEI